MTNYSINLQASIESDICSYTVVWASAIFGYLQTNRALVSGNI